MVYKYIFIELLVFIDKLRFGTIVGCLFLKNQVFTFKTVFYLQSRSSRFEPFNFIKHSKYKYLITVVLYLVSWYKNETIVTKSEKKILI